MSGAKNPQGMAVRKDKNTQLLIGQGVKNFETKF